MPPHGPAAADLKPGAARTDDQVVTLADPLAQPRPAVRRAGRRPAAAVLAASLLTATVALGATAGPDGHPEAPCVAGGDVLTVRGAGGTACAR